MTQRRSSSTRWAMPKLSVPRSAKHIVGALILSVTAAASHVHSARLTIAVNPSGIAATIAIEGSWWHSQRAASIRRAPGGADVTRVCPGALTGCWVHCGDVVIGPFSALGLTVTLYTRSVGSGGVSLGCIDIQLGPMMEVHALADDRRWPGTLVHHPLSSSATATAGLIDEPQFGIGSPLSSR